MMKVFKRIYSSLSIAILAVACISLLLFGWSGTGWKALIIPTRSMRPNMPPGTLVFVHRVPESSLKVGDVITYVSPLDSQRTITHRIIKKELIDGLVPGFITKGDANKVSDPPVVAGRVEGKVVGFLPEVGYLLLDLKKPIITLPIVYAAAILIIGEEVIRLRDYLKSQQPYILAGYKSKEDNSKGIDKRLALGLSLFAALILISAAMGPSVFALLKSNTVVMANNRITVAAINKCSGNTSNNNTVNINNSSTQTASSGSASNTGNTNGGNATTGNATTGNATNNNSTNVNVTITNC